MPLFSLQCDLTWILYWRLVTIPHSSLSCSNIFCWWFWVRHITKTLSLTLTEEQPRDPPCPLAKHSPATTGEMTSTSQWEPPVAWRGHHPWVKLILADPSSTQVWDPSSTQVNPSWDHPSPSTPETDRQGAVAMVDRNGPSTTTEDLCLLARRTWTRMDTGIYYL